MCQTTPNDQIAEEMFNAYGEHCGWKTFDGRDMPRWDGINDAVRGHWEAVAEYVKSRLIAK